MWKAKEPKLCAKGCGRPARPYSELCEYCFTAIVRPVPPARDYPPSDPEE